MTFRLQDLYLWLGFSPKAARLLIREQELDIPDKLRVVMNKNVNDICNVMRKKDDKTANRLPNEGQQVSVIAKENLKLAASLSHHRLKYTFD